jgi:hypothetical protein
LWSKKRSDAYDKRQKDSHDDFNEHNISCPVHEEVRSLRSRIPERERIGQLAINSIEDYVDDDTVSFWSNDKIELGRYGPFRPEDRKPELHLNIKNFLFECERLIPLSTLFALIQPSYSFFATLYLDEPNEWAYAIGDEEKLTLKHEQERKMMIDITDDTTGQVHELARQHSSIYVNEVGHTDLPENV